MLSLPNQEVGVTREYIDVDPSCDVSLNSAESSVCIGDGLTRSIRISHAPFHNSDPFDTDPLCEVLLNSAESSLFSGDGLSRTQRVSHAPFHNL